MKVLDFVSTRCLEDHLMVFATLVHFKKLLDYTESDLIYRTVLF